MRRLAASLLFVALVPDLASARVRDDCEDMPCWHDRDDYGYDYERRFYPEPEPLRVRRADVDRLLESAALEDCLAPLVGRHSGTVRARVDRDGAVTVEVAVRPASEDAETCLRRTAEAVLQWGRPIRVGSTIRTTLRVRSRGTEPDAAPSIAAAVDAVRPAVSACLAADVPASGRLELTLRARRTGHIRLVSARLGAFVPGDDAEACLEGIVAALRVPPSTDEATIEIELGSELLPVPP